MGWAGDARRALSILVVGVFCAGGALVVLDAGGVVSFTRDAAVAVACSCVAVTVGWTGGALVRSCFAERVRLTRDRRCPIAARFVPGEGDRTKGSSRVAPLSVSVARFASDSVLALGSCRAKFCGGSSDVGVASGRCE